MSLREASTGDWELMRGPGQMMIRQQDETIDTIAGTLNTIHEQAGLMGREIGEHNECVHGSRCVFGVPFSLLGHRQDVGRP